MKLDGSKKLSAGSKSDMSARIEGSSRADGCQVPVRGFVGRCLMTLLCSMEGFYSCACFPKRSIHATDYKSTLTFGSVTVLYVVMAARRIQNKIEEARRFYQNIEQKHKSAKVIQRVFRRVKRQQHFLKLSIYALRRVRFQV